MPVPSQCQPIATEIQGLEAERADLQAELRAAAPAEKPAIVRQMAAVTIAISQQRVALADCMAANPQPPPPPPPPAPVWVCQGLAAEISELESERRDLQRVADRGAT